MNVSLLDGFLFARATKSANATIWRYRFAHAKDTPVRDYREAKVMAQTLRESLAAKNLTVSHSESLELVSKMLGLPDWNTLSAKIQETRKGAGLRASNNDSLADTKDERSQKIAEQAAPRTAVPFASQRFDKFVGYYQTDPGTLLRVFRKGERFYGQITGQSPVEIYPEGEFKFFMTVVEAQITFIANSREEVTDLVLHQDGFERPWKRIDRKNAERLIATLEQRITHSLPDPRTEKALRRLIEGIISGNPHYDDMEREQAQAVRDQLSHLQPFIGKKGKITSVRFVGVQDDGDDIYHVEHEKRLFRWTIGLGSSGKIERSWVTSGG